MAHEIRVLEDQLYEADYHNRVLIDKLEQIRLKSEAASKSPGRDDRSYDTSASPVPSRQRTERGESSSAPLRDPGSQGDSSWIPPELPQLDSPSDKAAPGAKPEEPSGRERSAPSDADPLQGIGDLDAMIDEGESVPLPQPESADEPTPPAEPSADAPAEPNMEADSDELLPAPGGPEPPGKSDLELPPVLPGEVLPPSSLDEEEAKPPGQIVLPDSAQAVVLPDQLRVHPSLSGGQRVDGQVANMMIIVNVLDQQGRPIDLSDFNVHAELSVVLFDGPDQPTDETRLGRWDFNSEQIQNLIQSDPISGFHVPIQWQGRQPSEEEMQVHVRLRSEEDEMRCEARLKVVRANAVAEWAPRGESLK